MNYANIIKRINKAIDTVSNKMGASKVHIIEPGTEYAELSGLVIICNRSKDNFNTSRQSKSQATDKEIAPNVG